MQLKGHVASPSEKPPKTLSPTLGDVQAAAVLLLDTLAELAAHARAVDADRPRRRALAVAQVADKARAPRLLLALIVWNRSADAASV